MGLNIGGKTSQAHFYFSEQIHGEASLSFEEVFFVQIPWLRACLHVAFPFRLRQCHRQSLTLCQW